MNTKFNIGDKVWYLDSTKKAVHGTIYKIDHSVEEGKADKTMYFARVDMSVNCLYEQDMFVTKDELATHIFG